jgi:hypothetical protein
MIEAFCETDFKPVLRAWSAIRPEEFRESGGEYISFLGTPSIRYVDPMSWKNHMDYAICRTRLRLMVFHVLMPADRVNDKDIAVNGLSRCCGQPRERCPVSS